MIQGAMTAVPKKLQVRVNPNPSQSRLEAQEDGSWLAWLRSPPVEGKANKELLALVAGHFGVSKSRVHIKSGSSGRSKLVVIDA